MEPLARAISSQRGQYLLEPRLAAWYVPGTFDDDIVIQNASPYNLSDFAVEVKLKYRKDGQEKAA